MVLTLTRLTHALGQPPVDLTCNNNKLVLILTRHTLARAGLANRLLDRLEVVTDNGELFCCVAHTFFTKDYHVLTYIHTI